MSMNRRGFFNMIPKGAAAVAVAGAAATEVVNEVAAKPAVEEVKKSLPPEKKTFSVMQAVNPEPKEVRVPVDRGPNVVSTSASSGSYGYVVGKGLTPTMGTFETSVNIGGNGNQQVDFGVNDDGELWIRGKNGDWKKVVTE